MRELEYRGHTISRVFPSGYYRVFFANFGSYSADTVAGVRGWVDQFESGELV